MDESDEARDFSEIAADLPDDEDIEFNDDMRQADNKALEAVMADAAIMQRCERRLGVDNMAALWRNHHSLASSDMGQVVEAVVTTYGAPHLRPTSIQERLAEESTADGACWSLLSFFNYAAVAKQPRPDSDASADKEA
mmetsp:Transcript_9419/g.24399  ORF Transcript_9419/g.24399 Transcript_9419/m.24399 type:complete len:138 (-) Transcript_9419:119-532(-)